MSFGKKIVKPNTWTNLQYSELSRREGFPGQSARSSKMFRKQSKIDQINVIERKNIEGLGSKIFDSVSVPPNMRQSTADLPAHPLNP
jgi:hypothetical protein